MQANGFSGVRVVIPTYNEQRTIGEMIVELREAGLNNIIVVDDSTDMTPSICDALRVEILKGVRGRKRGVGGALRTGMMRALSDKRTTHVLVVDAGGSHRVSDAVSLATAGVSGEADIIIGSRFLPKHDDQPWTRRKIVSALAAAMLSRAVGSRVYDASSGMRCYAMGAPFMRALAMSTAKNFAVQLELLGYSMALGASVKELPIQYAMTGSTFRPDMIPEAMLAVGHVWAVRKENERKARR